MKKFAKLFRLIENTTKSSEKIQLLTQYLQEASDDDKLWTLALFSHLRPKRTISTAYLREWCLEYTELPAWLFEQCYQVVGDLAETICLLASDNNSSEDKSLTTWIQSIKEQKDKTVVQKKKFVLQSWSTLSSDEIFIFNKIITGGFRIGITQKTITKALSAVLDIHESHLAHKLMGPWSPDSTSYQALLLSDPNDTDSSKPYPLYLAHSLDLPIESLGDPEDWQVEYKWHGIRSQLIKRKGEVHIWSRGEELMTLSYPEFNILKEVPADNFVIDGQLVVFTSEGMQSLSQLQKRIGKKTISKKFLQLYPCAIICYDLLENDGLDIRENTLSERRLLLEQLLNLLKKDDETPLLLSEAIEFEEWQDLISTRALCRNNRTDGLMLKRRDGIYKNGRQKGEWWKWKVEPLSVDAVLLYAHRENSIKSNLFSDFTFAVWSDNGTLIPFTKAYSGLTEEELEQITRFVSQNTIEKFGPVRSVKPELVFEISFDGIHPSSRHKSGIALQSPKIQRWRKDKTPDQANTLAFLKEMLPPQGL